ncbi:hypothetical protein PQQ84_05480 [Paraburkholderia strydomiana]|uniref:hypothetical protein n=1 Tax=Paraburkholderia strydomiana TaxID=1245417 RepID=UPI0038B933D8
MEQKAIGPSFIDELTAAGGLVGQHFSWDNQGNLYFFDDTPKSVIDGVKSVYAAHDPDKPSWAAYKANAQDALDKTDIVAIRCVKSGVSFPKEWQTYCAALRAIVSAASGDATQPLPAQPEYPDGT